MVECLDNLVGKCFWSLQGGISLNGGLKSNVLKLRYQGDLKGDSEGARVVGDVKKGWRQAIIVVRFCIKMSWRNIYLGLADLFNIQHEITPLSADRAIIWSGSQEEKRRLEKIGLCNIKGWNSEVREVESRITV